MVIPLLQVIGLGRGKCTQSGQWDMSGNLSIQGKMSIPTSGHRRLPVTSGAVSAIIWAVRVKWLVMRLRPCADSHGTALLQAPWLTAQPLSVFFCLFATDREQPAAPLYKLYILPLLSPPPLSAPQTLPDLPSGDANQTLLLLKVWSLDQQEQHLTSCQKSRT